MPVGDHFIRIFVTRRDRNNAIRWLAILALLLAAAYVGLRQYVPALSDPDAIRAWVEGFGVLAPLAFIAVQALQVVVAPVPAHVFVLFGGFLFGAVAGTIYSLVGAAIGTAIAFWLSRRYGRQYVERVVSPTVLQRFDGLADDHALAGFFAAFLVPGLPDDILCFVAGLTTIRLSQLLVVSAVGRLPSYVLINFIGAELAQHNLGVALALAGVFVVLAAVTYHYRKQLLHRLSG